MPQITKQQLIDHKACQTQVDFFSELFGESGEVTVDACLAVAGCFDFDWAARYLLSPSACMKYARVNGAAYTECRRVRTDAHTEFLTSNSPNHAEYDRVCKFAWGKYKDTLARAFAEAYLSQ